MKYFFYFISILIIVSYSAIAIFKNDFYLKAIPAPIQIHKILKEREDGFIRESCGGVIFQLSQSTIEKVEKQGLVFLNQDLHGRGYKDENERKRINYTYNPWTKTPLNLGEGLSPGLHCLLKDDKAMAKKVLSAAEREGSFHTVKHEAELLLVPELGLLFYAWDG